MTHPKLSARGKVVIPKLLTDRFGIKGGQEVQVEESEKGVLVMKSEENPLKAMTGLFEGKTAKSSTELVRDVRKESESRIKEASLG